MAAKPIDLEFMVSGIKFRQEEYNGAEVKSGDLLTLEPEPSNQHDPNAIKVLKGTTQIGYVPRALCENILLRMQSGPVTTQVINAWNKGCSVKVSGGPS